MIDDQISLDDDDDDEEEQDYYIKEGGGEKGVVVSVREYPLEPCQQE